MTNPLDAMWNKVAALRPRADIPPESFTEQEYAEHFKVSVGLARLELSEMVAQGTLRTELANELRKYWPA